LEKCRPLYRGTSGGQLYELKITENTARYTAQSGDYYELTGTKKSTGTVDSVSGDVLTLQPSLAGAASFTANVSGTSLTALKGTITWTDKTETTVAPAEQLAAEFNAIIAGIAKVDGATVTLTGGFFFRWADEGNALWMHGETYEFHDGICIRKFHLTVPAGVTLDVTADNAALGLGNMTFTVDGTVNTTSNSVRFEDGASEATVNGSGSIYLKSKGNLLTIEGNKNVANRELTLDGVTLVGLPDNSDPLVIVRSGGDNRTGTFIMKSGAITGNTNDRTGEDLAGGGGVLIDKGGTFIMEGGTIWGNKVTGNSGNNSGGVRVEFSAKFTLKGGTIYGNVDSLPAGVGASLANSAQFNAALSVGNQEDGEGTATVKWGTGGAYTKGGVSQTGGSDILTASGGDYGTDDTLIAR